MAQKEIELTPENPVAYIHVKRKEKDFEVEYCKDIKPYINNVNVNKESKIALKPDYNVLSILALFTVLVIIGLLSVSLGFFAKDELLMKYFEFLMVITFNFAYILQIYIHTRSLKIVDKLQVDTFKQYIKAFKITNVLYVVFMIIQLCVLIYFMI